MKHRSWILFSGFIWLCIGMFLLYKGIMLISEAVANHSLVEKQGMMFLGASLAVGYAKGRFVLSKTVNRMVAHISALSLPIQVKGVYPRSYWILIASMMGLGMLFRFLPIPLQFRGAIDVTIGYALINGALLYFRSPKILKVAP